jgi:drug/metabolite transporter (DMT)-like permease
MLISQIWIITTIMAAAAQTARNTMQRRLTAEIGTLGATQVRFLYGFPFSLLFLAIVQSVGGETLPTISKPYLLYVAAGAVSQIAATALMLLAMKEKSFSVTTAYTKTEPVQVALVGLLLLGDRLTIAMTLAILIATSGVMLMAIKKGERITASGLRPMVFGVAAGGFFALSAVAFRGGILGLGEHSFVLRATTTLAWSLGIQTLILLIYMTLFDRAALIGSFKAWRSSIFAGLMGAVASQFWFIGFSLTSAAHVRTLGLVEVIFAQIVTRKVLIESVSPREWLGMSLVVIGVGALLLFG